MVDHDYFILFAQCKHVFNFKLHYIICQLFVPQIVCKFMLVLCYIFYPEYLLRILKQ